jgi:hypothetical protein
MWFTKFGKCLAGIQLWLTCTNRRKSRSERLVYWRQFKSRFYQLFCVFNKALIEEFSSLKAIKFFYQPIWKYNSTVQFVRKKGKLFGQLILRKKVAGAKLNIGFGTRCTSSDSNKLTIFCSINEVNSVLWLALWHMASKLIEFKMCSFANTTKHLTMQSK